MNLIEREISYKIHKAGFEVFIVGGAVRDFLLGITPKDYDFATNATPNEILTIFKKYGKSVCTVGKAFKVVMVHGVEIATYRKDKQTKMFSAKCCEPTYANSIEEDLERRDLTINAMALRCFDGLLNEKIIIDPFNGARDLKNKIIRMVGNPYERINQDPCRILRACRFLAQIEGTFEQETLQALQNCAHYVKDYVEPERIRIEIMKSMELNTPSLFFSALHLIGALQYIFPEMNDCFNHNHGKYHTETIGEHLLQAGDNISKRFPLLRLAAFLHDVGKPIAFKQQNDGSFIHHEHIGAKIAKKRLKNLKFSNYEVNYITNLIYVHMRQSRNIKSAGKRRLCKKLHDLKIKPRDFVRLKIADRQANVNKGKSEITPIKELLRSVGIKSKEEIPFTVKNLALKGGEIIEIFNLQPSPLIGNLQKKLLNYVLEKGIEVNKKEILIQKIKTYLMES